MDDKERAAHINEHRMRPFDIKDAEELASQAAEMAFQRIVMISYTRDEMQDMLSDVLGDAMEQAAYKAIYASE